ncbi:MAG TPA: MBL fold metallo-hydrolase [Stellaceae bacterium]|jgi:ribonuclease Z|nr:MBL fold metallo-hydrolase [Stellaceae bacterium]
MYQLTFLGTAASVPSIERNQPGLLVTVGDKRILIDCGEGTQRQLLRSGQGFRHFHRLLLTHDHLDHILGVPGLLSTLGLQKSDVPLLVNGGPHTLGTLTRMMAALWGECRAPIPLAVAAIGAEQVIDEGDFTITCFPVWHRDTDSFGYVFEGRSRRHLSAAKLVEFGVPDGPLRGELASGRPVTLPDGRVLDPETFLGPEVPGTKLVVIGDAGSTAGLADVAHRADALVIEATFLARDADTARGYGHLTAAEAAQLAADAGVGRLVLTHISGRYPPEEILAEARRIFPETMIAADLDRLSV